MTSTCDNATDKGDVLFGYTTLHELSKDLFRGGLILIDVDGKTSGLPMHSGDQAYCSVVRVKTKLLSHEG
jgi:hypothetical protein